MYFRHVCLTRDGSGDAVITHRTEHYPKVFNQSRQVTIAFCEDAAGVAICSNKDSFCLKEGRNRAGGRLKAGLSFMNSGKSKKNPPVFCPIMQIYSPQEIQNAVNAFLDFSRSKKKEANNA